MTTTQWPHRMTRGLLKGEDFESKAAYDVRLKEKKRELAGEAPQSANGTPHFAFILKWGTEDVSFRGSPESPQDWARLLALVLDHTPEEE